jgi:hypothetical protein
MKIEDSYHAQHKVINPLALGSKNYLQFSVDKLQPWIGCFSGRIN